MGKYRYKTQTLNWAWDILFVKNIIGIQKYFVEHDPQYYGLFENTFQ